MEAHELTTDLAVRYAGFGVIDMASAFAASAWGGPTGWGWQTNHRGYLSQEMRAFALGLFLRAKETDAAEAEAHLGDGARRLLSRALRQLDRQPDRVAALRGLASAD